MLVETLIVLTISCTSNALVDREENITWDDWAVSLDQVLWPHAPRLIDSLDLLGKHLQNHTFISNKCRKSLQHVKRGLQDRQPWAYQSKYTSPLTLCQVDELIKVTLLSIIQ